MATSHGRLAVVLLLLCAASGCRRSQPTADGPLAVRDDAGRTVALPRPAQRVVALIPSVNETLLALGAGARIVARTDYDHDPRLAHLPSLGGGLTPNIEWLAAQRPDLVVSWPDERARAVVSRLQAVGVPVYAARVESLGDAYRTTLELGRLLGLERRADTLVARWRAALDSIAVRAAAEPAPRVLYLIGLDPPEVAGRGTFVDELLRIAGGRNVFEDVPLWPNVSLEEAIRRDPDVVILSLYDQTGDVVGRFRAAPGWRDLRAVRAGRVAWLDPDLANRPGPRAPLAARMLFQALHPTLVSGRGRGRAVTADGETARRRDGGIGRPSASGETSAPGSPTLTGTLGRRNPASSPSRRPAVPPSPGRVPCPGDAHRQVGASSPSRRPAVSPSPGQAPAPRAAYAQVGA